MSLADQPRGGDRRIDFPSQHLRQGYFIRHVSESAQTAVIGRRTVAVGVIAGVGLALASSGLGFAPLVNADIPASPQQATSAHHLADDRAAARLPARATPHR